MSVLHNLLSSDEHISIKDKLTYVEHDTYK